MENNPLDARTILAQLDTQPSLVVLDTVSSTNDYLRENPAQVCIAEQQTQGKGRRGNTWVATDSPIAFSLRWQFPDTPTTLSNLAMLVGVLCAHTLHQLGYDEVEVKWPNDLMAQGGKLGGILVENFSQKSCATVIVGIGINTYTAPTTDQLSCSLYGLKKTPIDRNHMIALLLNVLFAALTDYSQQTVLQDYWPRFDGLKNKEVCVLTSRGEVFGIACGIAADGALQLATAQGIETFYSGDVRLRKLT